MILIDICSIHNLFISTVRKIKTEESCSREGNRYTSDLFSLLGTVILWVFWPSFNGLLATGAARHRAVINTYLRSV